MSLDNIMVELLSDMLASELNAVRDESGDYELPRQSVSREQVETIASMMYEAITFIEIERLGKKLLEDGQHE